MLKLFNYFIFFTLLSMHSLYANKTNDIFTEKEKKYLEKHPVLLAHNEKNWPPFNFIENGIAKGYSIDYINLLASKIEVKVKFISGYTWNEYMNMLQTPNLDLIINISKNKEREKEISFTNVFLSLKNAIYVNINNNGYTNINLLNNHEIAMPNGFYAQKFIQNNYPKIKQRLVNDQLEALKLLSKGEVDATIGKKVVMDYLLQKNEITNIKFTEYINNENIVSHMRIGSSKKDTILIDILNKAQQLVTDEEKARLNFKWLGLSMDNNINNINLSEKEKDYLKEKKVLNVCVNLEKMPLEKVEKNKNSIGLFSDYLNLINKKINIFINIIPSQNSKDSIRKLKNKECDITNIISDSLPINGIKYIHKYLDTQILIGTRQKEIYISNLNYYINRIFTIRKDSLFYDELKKEYPKLKLLEVDSLKDGLIMVEKGKAFGHIDNAIMLSYEIRKNFFGTITIAGNIDKSLSYNLVSRIDEEILNSILKKVIKSISKYEKRSIENKWLQFNENSLIDYNLIIKIIVTFLILIALLIFFIKKQNKLKNKINNLNKTLSLKIKQEIKENKEKDVTIYKQAKLISMGEMISNIAHQWRQPLFEINSVIMNLESDFYNKQLNKKSLETNLEQIENLTEHMSNTIDNFYDFFNNDKVKTKFLISTNINKVLNLFENTFKKANIKIKLNLSDDVMLETYEGEFLQVLIILLQNSKDAFISNNIHKPIVYIDVSTIENKLVILIKDNAGGIKSEIIDKIFEPYFSTKIQGQAIGLGLYLCKQILEKSIHARLEVQSSGDTTSFTITVPL